MKTAIRSLIAVLLIGVFFFGVSFQVFAGTTDMNLEDAVHVLKVLTNPPYLLSDIDIANDIDGDKKIGLPETIHMLQSISGVWYKDADNDGYFDGTIMVSRHQADGYTTAASLFDLVSIDCNDDNKEIHPGAPEICSDGIDQDCNGSDCRGVERFAGKYTGSFSGDSRGSWSLTVDKVGDIFGTARETSTGFQMVLIGTVSSDGSLGLTQGFSSSGVRFQGTMDDSSGQIQGTWKDQYYNYDGTFAGTGQFMEPSGSFDQYKGLYYGTYTGSGQYGDLYAGVDAFGNLAIITDDEDFASTTITATGQFSANMYTEDGYATLSGQVNSYGKVSGTWNLQGLTGTFSATRQ